jgi:CHAT domain-containing protein
VYEAHILLCLQAGSVADLKEAFATVEQARSRALLELLVREAEAAVSPEAELVAELERLKRELNWYYNRLNGTQSDSGERSPQQMRGLIGLMTAVSAREQALSQLLNRWRMPDLAATPRNPVWTVSLEQMQASLPPHSLLLEFYATEASVLVFGISPQEAWSYQLVASVAEITDVLGQLRFQMNKFSYGTAYSGRHAEALHRSANDVLQRLYDLLLAPIADRLTADTLMIVPHGPLHYVPFHALYNGNAYLLEQKTISYAPSATILYRTLLNPLFSALKLADGWLSVNDLYTFPAMPPLVTLSACETGRYQVAVGDELMGLCRGLFAAGAQSVVVSLWMAEDEALCARLNWLQWLKSRILIIGQPLC